VVKRGAESAGAKRSNEAMGLEIVGAFLLGLRHAAEPDHLVAVTSLVASEEGDTPSAIRLGAWGGAGHAAVLVLVGLPLNALKSELPSWLEHGAETAIGVLHGTGIA
jgi:high-affinity nickel permease